MTDLLARAFASVPADRSGAHLADFAFRFAPAPPRPAVPRPAEGEAWTLAQTLQELRLRNARLRETSRGLRVLHAHRLPALAEAVGRHETAVRVWRQSGAGAPRHGWDDATDLAARWLEGFEPDGPVEVRPGETVTDWPTFAASVAGRFAEGPDAVAAPTLRRDLAALFERFARPAESAFVPRRRALVA